MATLTFEGVSKTDAGPDGPVHDIDLDIADGAFVALIGQPGAGGPTLLRLVAGLERISRGALLIDGRSVTGLSPAARDIAMVFRDDALYPHMTVRENLAYGLRNRGEDKASIAVKIDEAAAGLGIDGALSARPNALSAEQRRRVAIGRAIVRSPKLYLFDDPLADLDATRRSQLRLVIKRLHRELGVTTLYATSDLAEAMTLADRIVLMNEGRIEQDATPDEFYAAPATLFAARSLASPAMNFLPAEVRQGAVWFGDVGFAHLDRPDNMKVTIGVRPEHFRLRDVGSSPLGGVVDEIEHRGSEILVHVSVLKDRVTHHLVVRAAPEEAPEIGLAVGIDLVPGKEHVFDEAGRRVSG